MLEHYCLATLSHITINRINVNDNCRFLQSGGAEVSSLHSESLWVRRLFLREFTCVPRVPGFSKLAFAVNLRVNGCLSMLLQQ